MELILVLVLPLPAQQEKAKENDLHDAFVVLTEQLRSDNIKSRDNAQGVLLQKAADDSSASSLVPLIEEALDEEKDLELAGRLREVLRAIGPQVRYDVHFARIAPDSIADRIELANYCVSMNWCYQAMVEFREAARLDRIGPPGDPGSREATARSILRGARAMLAKKSRGWVTLLFDTLDEQYGGTSAQREVKALRDEVLRETIEKLERALDAASSIN